MDKPLFATDDVMAESRKMLDAARILRSASDRAEIALRFAVAMVERQHWTKEEKVEPCLMQFAFAYADAFIAARDGGK